MALSITDSVGNVGTVTAVFTLDATAPVSPVVTSVGDDATATYTTADTTPTITGTGEVGAIITLKNASGTVLGTGTVDASGNWSIGIIAEHVDGTYTYILTSTDSLGNISANTDISFSVSTVPGPGGGGGSSSVPASTPAPVTNEATPQKSLPIIDTTKKDTQTRLPQQSPSSQLSPSSLLQERTRQEKRYILLSLLSLTISVLR